jgi:uncharacterized membrane protein YccF (DUF307 family)
MRLLGNILWLICGGLISSALYCLGGIVLCLTIVGIPFGLQKFKIAVATLAPFGKEVVELPDANSTFRLVLNALWVLTIGWGLALNHLFWALLLAVTGIGIPFAAQHLKLVPLALFPFGRALLPPGAWRG